MKKILMAILLAGCGAIPAFASLSAELKFYEKDAGNSTRLYAQVSLAGIADCPKEGSVTIKFTSPDEQKIESSEFEAPWRSCTTKEGRARTRAYRTITVKGNRVPGTWKVQVVSGKTVLAEGTYLVK